MNVNLIRKKTINRLSGIDVEIPSSVPPLIDDDIRQRNIDESIGRLLGIYYVLIYLNLDEEDQKYHLGDIENDLKNNQYKPIFTESELVLFSSNKQYAKFEKMYNSLVGSAYALSWSHGVVKSMSLESVTPDTFGKLLPRFHDGETDERYVCSINPRSKDKVLEELDVYYCAHWYIVESMLKGRHCVLDYETITSRRQSLEWLMLDVEWDDISLDT